MNDKEVYILTTFDNPFNPFNDYDNWFQYDTENGYNSCSLLARIAKVHDNMTEAEKVKETNKAIDEIIKYDILNIYTRITKDTIIGDKKG